MKTTKTKIIIVFFGIVFFLVNLNSQNIRDYDLGYKDVKWGSSLVEAKELITEKPDLDKPYSDRTTEAMKILGHSDVVLYYTGETISDVVPTIIYSFVDDKFYSTEKIFVGLSDEVKKAYYDAIGSKLNKQYGKGKQINSGIKWRNNTVSITLNDNVNPTYGWHNVTLTIESNKFKKLYDTIQKEADTYEKKKTAETAKKMLD